MENENIADKIIELKEKDLKLRNRLIENTQLNDGYNEDMAQLHKTNATRLNEIIDSIGYPTIEKVGKEASEAAWLIIQHSIGQPEFMKNCALLLKRAVIEKKAKPQNLAYLTDRIAVFEGKPQRYGTQYDWDENGQLSPEHFEDVDKVNQRRLSIGLNSLEEQTAIIRNRAKAENQLPPTDFDKRKNEKYEWRKSVGWIK